MSSGINTGKERGIEVTITKTVGGVLVEGYPRVYKLTDDFGSLPAKTVEESTTMEVNDYQTRLNAFKAYIESIEIGVTVDITVAYRDNIIACPIQ